MKKYLFIPILMLLAGVHTFAQSPNWSVNENNFQYSMTFVAFLNIDGTTLSNTNDKVGAFVDGECRGVSELIYVSSKDAYFAYLTVFSNSNAETIKFKVYNSITDKIQDIEKSKGFEIDKHYGNLFQAYSIASPTLSSQADILDFGFKDFEIKNKFILDGLITFETDFIDNAGNVNATFELSNGAKLLVKTTEKKSGENTLDFRTPVTFQVMSADQSVLKTWEVSLSTGDATFYKKNAVCYNGGMIKVLYSAEDTEVILTKEGASYATQKIVGGQTTFENLEVGTYNVTVEGNFKQIVIDLKQ